MTKIIHLSPEKKERFDILYSGMAMTMNAKRLKAWEKYYKTVTDFDLFLECFKFDAKNHDYKFAILPEVSARYDSLLKAKTIGSTAAKNDHDHHDEVSFLIRDCAAIQQQIDTALSKGGKTNVYRIMALNIFQDSLKSKKERILELQALGADATLAKNPNYLCTRCRNIGWVHIVEAGTSPHYVRPINHTKKHGKYSYITHRMLPCECKKGQNIMMSSKVFVMSGDSHRHMIAEYAFKNESRAVKFVQEHRRDD